MRPGRSRSAKVAVSTLAGLASVSTGAAGAGTLAGAAESLGARILDDGGAVAYSATVLADAPEVVHRPRPTTTPAVRVPRTCPTVRWAASRSGSRAPPSTISSSRVQSPDDDTVTLEPYDGPWADDDPDANFKADVALYSQVDPMVTIRTLSRNVGVPEGALVRYVLARYATGGSGGLLELGPTMVHRLWEPIERAERAGLRRARLDAYSQLRQMIQWLRLPLEDPTIYPEQP